MQVEIIKATIEQKPLLANLLELYAYDFTEFCNFDIGDDGFYGYERLPLYWTEATRFPYLIYVDKKIAGFVLVQKGSPISDNKTVWDISEFFIMKKYKRYGIGTAAALKVWEQFKGSWQIRVLVSNHIACLFWLQAIKKFTLATPIKNEIVIKDEKWIIYAFESKDKPRPLDKIEINFFNKSDIEEIVLAFKEIGWDKPKSLYDLYLKESEQRIRTVFVARYNGKFCGYVTVKWKSAYQVFSYNNIPEISDLNVLPEFRKKGIGTQLIRKCEHIAKEFGYKEIGLGVGMTADYGNAQRLYHKLGFIPDGNGLHYKSSVVNYAETVKADDDLVIYQKKYI